jgi:hypothetical protein
MRLIILAVMALLYGFAWHDRSAKDQIQLHLPKTKRADGRR